MLRTQLHNTMSNKMLLFSKGPFWSVPHIYPWEQKEENNKNLKKEIESKDENEKKQWTNYEAGWSDIK